MRGVIQAMARNFGRADSAKSLPSSIRALEEVSFAVEDGDRLAIIGRNGAGKSSLLKVLSGILKPSSGEVEVIGERTSLLDMTYGIESELTGREAMILRARVLGISSRLGQSELDQVIDFSGLRAVIDLPTKTYSAGMLMRLAFAISTEFSPEIIIMDEWLSVGDEDFREKAEQRMSNLVSDASLVVLATHSRDLTEKVCNKALWLEAGQVKMFGPVSEVSTRYFGDS
jgi:lipopolysaccharide transport system ATP-binding protein